jgi:hypothetical protein
LAKAISSDLEMGVLEKVWVGSAKALLSGKV